MAKYCFEVPGPPRGKGRPRFTRTGVVYTDRATSEYEQLIRTCCNVGEMLDRPVRLTITAYSSPPKSTTKKLLEVMMDKPRPKKPDIDNVVKAVMDALNGRAYTDDRLVTTLTVSKRYSQRPRLLITIEGDEDA